MEVSLIHRLIGVALTIVGVTLVWNLELVSNKPIPSDTFKATERRIWRGLIIGFGSLLLFHHQLQPWIPAITATAVSLMFGLLVARLIGIMLDGSVMK